VQASDAGTHVLLTLNSIPNGIFTIQLFASTTPDATGYGQGKTLVATIPMVATDASGNAKGPNGAFIEVDVKQNLSGLYLTATATDARKNTSEFAKDVQGT